jgi:hypothetical protein
MNTPYFPQFRARLAPARRAATQKIQQASLAQLEHYLEGIFPLISFPRRMRETTAAIASTACA